MSRGIAITWHAPYTTYYTYRYEHALAQQLLPVGTFDISCRFVGEIQKRNIILVKMLKCLVQQGYKWWDTG